MVPCGQNIVDILVLLKVPVHILLSVGQLLSIKPLNAVDGIYLPIFEQPLNVFQNMYGAAVVMFWNNPTGIAVSPVQPAKLLSNIL